MNYTLIQKIIQKDWYFQRFAILGVLIAGTVALGLISLPNETWSGAGSILLITVLITFGALLATSTVIAERSSHTLPFLMSLPISVKDYTVAKIVGNLLLFCAPWLTLLIASIVVITTRPNLPDGLVAYSLVMLTELLVNYCLLLCVSLITESTGWSVTFILIGNLIYQAFLFGVSSLPSVRSVINQPNIAWNSTFSLVLLLEIIVMVVLLGITFMVQFRKTDFV